MATRLKHRPHTAPPPPQTATTPTHRPPETDSPNGRLPGTRRARRTRRRLRRGDLTAAYVPARAEVAVLGLIVAVSAVLTALPLPIRWS